MPHRPPPRHRDPDRRPLRRSILLALLKALAALALVSLAVAVTLLLTASGRQPEPPPGTSRTAPDVPSV